MTEISRRASFSPQSPYRSVRPSTSKIIFISCEGSVTEEEYFGIISNIYSEIKSKVQLISVVEDAVKTIPRFRTNEQNKTLSKVRPKHLLERIETFKNEKNDIYQFSEYPDDEFWIITDVDKNWSDEIIDISNHKSYKDEWSEVISQCKEKGYRYAVSNPFFEIWLLLHHDFPTDEDESFAVTEEHNYEKTNHFKERLKNLGAPIRDKHIDASDYSAEKIKDAVCRAEQVHIDKEDLCPQYFATTVYLLLQKIIDMLPN